MWGEEHRCFTEQYVCRKMQCACECAHYLVLSFPFAEKVEPKTRIKPADHAYFSVADGYLQHGMQGKHTDDAREADKCNRILPIVYTILR
jgi:hypothetical protein